MWYPRGEPDRHCGGAQLRIQRQMMSIPRWKISRYAMDLAIGVDALLLQAGWTMESSIVSFPLASV